jgi:aminoglycoside phosphotransferase (APT) family kinase protein
MFTGDARATFRDALAPDDATWRRGRGWAVRCVYGLVYYRETNAGIVARCQRRLRALIDEYEAAG